ncbi:MAG: hypothetical protein SGILL_002756 [Bacillariaceae sp.]
MYFDDAERLEGEEVLSPESSIYRSNWITSYQEEKRLALQNLLGYQPSSAAKLTDEQVEEETLRWAIDTNIVWVEDDMAENDDDENENIHDNMQGSKKQQQQRRGKYDSIQDLKVASNCDTVLESLAFCWSVIADVLQEQQDKDQQGDKSSAASDSSSAHLVVFSKSLPLWNYEVMVDMLLAIQISKPFLPAEYNLLLDLFHPDYKHSPRIWSPERHAPFPTLGISLQHKKTSSTQEMEMDIEATRAKLDKLFQSMDANREYITSSKVDPENDQQNSGQILQDCMAWMSSKQQTMPNDVEWTIHTHQGRIGGPIHLYKTLWNTILTLPSSSTSTSSSIVVVPSLDSHTLHRVAVTVNAALIRLNIPARITQVYTPFPTTTSIKGSFASPPPYGMIQLTPISDGIE